MTNARMIVQQNKESLTYMQKNNYIYSMISVILSSYRCFSFDKFDNYLYVSYKNFRVNLWFSSDQHTYITDSTINYELSPLKLCYERIII